MKTLRSYTKNVIANSSVMSGTKWSLFDHLATCCLSGHDPRMGRRISTCLLGCAIIMFCITACDDSSSGAGPDPVAEVSSSSGDDAISSSSVTDKGTSSGGGSVSSGKENSSSSAKSSSSTDSKSSSSVTSSSSGTSAGTNSSSGDSALEPCDAEEEGETKRVLTTGVRYICKNGFWVEVESSSSVSSSSYFDMTEQFNPDVEYGEFTDPRDGQKYRTVSLYDDVYERTLVFFVENLNYGERVPGGTVQGKGTKYCYDDDPWYCDNGWGGLYTWSNAMGFPAVCDSVSIEADACAQKFEYPSGYIEPANYVQHQGICPEGWHVVNGGEWAYLDQKTGDSFAYYMGSKVAGFGSKNSYGLSILPAGYWQEKKFEHITESVGYYLPQQHKSQEDVAQAAYVNKNSFSRSGGALKTNALSVRCVKNY